MASSPPMAAAPVAPAAPEAPAVAPVASPATAPATAAPETTVMVPPERSLTEKLLGRKPTHDIEKQNGHDERDAKRKRKLATAGGLASILTILGIIGTTLVLSLASFVIGSYVFPMLACKMHGYSSQCMFTDWAKTGRSVGEFVSDHLPHAFGGGFHDQRW